MTANFGHNQIHETKWSQNFRNLNQTGALIRYLQLFFQKLAMFINLRNNMGNTSSIIAGTYQHVQALL